MLSVMKVNNAEAEQANNVRLRKVATLVAFGRRLRSSSFVRLRKLGERRAQRRTTRSRPMVLSTFENGMSY